MSKIYISKLVKVPLNDGTGRCFCVTDGSVHTCMICHKPKEYRNGCCHKCNESFIKHYEAGIKVEHRIFDYQARLSYGTKLKEGFALFTECGDG